jgi:hypothetical protein
MAMEEKLQIHSLGVLGEYIKRRKSMKYCPILAIIDKIQANFNPLFFFQTD